MVHICLESAVTTVVFFIVFVEILQKPTIPVVEGNRNLKRQLRITHIQGLLLIAVV